MNLRNFLGIKNTAMQRYFKDGGDMLLYANREKPLEIVILPAYNPEDPDPVGWVPAVNGDVESDFYCTVRAAKFVGHGNRNTKTAFLSPRTFDLSADDPYEAFVDYCSRSPQWSYLTKDGKGTRLNGDIEGEIFPSMRNWFVANAIDASRGPRGGVFLVELSEKCATSILYTLRKNGTMKPGLAFERDSSGELVFGDITNPKSALVIEVAYGGNGYVARPSVDERGCVRRMEIPDTLLQHRLHMEAPETFLHKTEGPQEMITRLAGMLRGYKAPDGTDEIEALKEAMDFAYGDKYFVDEEAQEVKGDPFAKAAASVVDSRPEKKAEAVNAAVERAVKHEAYTPANEEKKLTRTAKKASRPPVVGEAPGETVDPSDIKAMRELLRGGKA